MWCKTLILVTIVIQLCLAAPSKNSAETVKGVPQLKTNSKASIRYTVEVPLDHYNSLDYRTWTMGYHANMQYGVVDGPIYIYVADMQNWDDFWLNYGLVRDIAAANGGVLFTNEHRYFGPEAILP